MSERDLGKVYIKNEGDKKVNPTGTMKDRLAREYALLYQSEANFLKEKSTNAPEYIGKQSLTRFSLITSGNAGLALANAFAQKDLPPPKLLLDKHISPEILNKLTQARADIYLTDLSINLFSGKSSQEDPLSREQILELTNNQNGQDITSAHAEGYATSENPGAVVYSRLAHEIFRENPNEVYLPYGSGMLFEGIVYAQEYGENPYAKKLRANVFGAEPEESNSIADKLTAPTKPFRLFRFDDLEHYKNKKSTGSETGVYKVSEEDIKEALEVIKKKE